MTHPANSFLSRRSTLAGCLVALSTLLGCVHYQFGHRSLYQPDIHTVHVPIFQSESFRRGLGERITEAVVKEIEATTPYKVTSAASADSVLRGTLVDETKLVQGQNRFDEPRILQQDLQITYEWIDQRGELIRQPATLSLAPVLRTETVSNNGVFYPEAGQSITTAQKDAIEEFAKQVVMTMQAPW